MFGRAIKRQNYWTKVRKKAPKVPVITCPAIDDVLNQLDKGLDREVKQSKCKSIERKMEKLRIATEKRAGSGRYWHDTCKDTIRDLLGKKG